MPLLSKALLTVGTILLIHACYSAHEHASLTPTLATTFSPKASATSATTSSPPSNPDPFAIVPHPTSLPLDISIETLAAVFLICWALVLGADSLRPIGWRVWAGELERRGKRERSKGENDEMGGKAREEGGSGVQLGFGILDTGRRIGFLNIRAQRQEFADWIREGARGK